MSALYHTFIFNPLYNALVLIFSVFPWADAGIAVILLTILVRLILFPLSKKAVTTQVRMQEINPLLEDIRNKYKNNPEELGRRTLAVYRDNKVNPFSGIFLLLLQLPVIWALYQIFLHAGFPNIDASILYPFVNVPESISTQFLGWFNITAKSIPLAFLAALTTYVQLHIASKYTKLPESKDNSFGNDFAKTMQTQMKYVFPVMVFFIAYSISGVIALYWLTSNLFTIAQEIVIRKKLANVPARV